jgi:hypothetical protein
MAIILPISQSTGLRRFVGVLMINLKIDDLKPGMILDQPVRNRQGVLLLEAGSRITDKSIRIFKSWGVKEIAVIGDRSDSKGADDDVVVQEKETVEKRLKEKFCDVLDDPVMVAIFKAAGNRLMQDLQNRERKHEPS